jgi:hypothetical protein
MALALTATTAKAAPYKFVFTRDGAPTVQFFIADPVPVTQSDSISFRATASGFTYGDTAGTFTRLPRFVSSVGRGDSGISYSFSAAGDGFYNAFNGEVSSADGQLYTGSESAPQFKVGTFNLDSGSFEKVSISGGPGAPGPLAGVGLLPALAAFGALGASRQRRRQVLPAVRASIAAIGAMLPRLPAPRITVAFAQ